MGSLKSKEEYYKEIKAIVEDKEGNLLSTEYVNAKTKMKIKCKNNHEFMINPNNLKSGYWCTTCSRMRYTIDDLKQVALSYGGNCLSEKYIGNKNNYIWECRNSHIWLDNFYNVNNFNIWCQECKKQSTKLSWAGITAMVRKEGGHILGGKPKSFENDYIKFICASGHIFTRKITDFVYKDDRWCTECKYLKRKKKSYIRLKKFALTRGYELTETFDSYSKKLNTEKLLFKCSNNHNWECSSGNFYRKRNCKTCLMDNRRITEEEINSYIKEKDGTLLTPYIEYKHSKQKLVWKCSQGHEFFAVLDSVFRGGWCPTCNVKFISESKCKYIIEELTGLKFTKTRSVLTSKVNSDINKFLELDMYNKTLNLALEYNGEQHYRYVPYFHDDIDGFQRQVERDKIKKQTCEILGIKLITVPYQINNDQSKVNFIRNELLRLQIPIKHTNINMNEYYTRGGVIDD